MTRTQYTVATSTETVVDLSSEALLSGDELQKRFTTVEGEVAMGNVVRKTLEVDLRDASLRFSVNGRLKE